MLYSGFLAVATVLAVTIARAHRGGLTWSQAVPRGYKISLVGVAVFAIGGIGDLLWHTLFGIEVDLSTLLSPTHFVLTAGGVMIVAGPLSAAWDRESVFRAFGERAGCADGGDGQVRGGTSITLERVRTLAELRGLFGLILQAAILSGAALLLLRRGLLRAGDLSFLFTANAVAMLLMRGNLLAFTPLIVVALASGLLGDLVLAVLRPSSVRRWPLRLLAFAMPACYTTGFFVYVLTLGGTWWELPDVTGTIVLTGFVGLLLSYLVVAPIPIRLGGAARS